MAMPIAIIMIVLLTLLSGYLLQLGYNQKKLMVVASGKRAKTYYRATAGAVEAEWRIRVNRTTGLAPAGTFTNDAYDPNPYNIDVDADGTDDCTINIGPVLNAALKNRRIQSTGCENAAPC